MQNNYNVSTYLYIYTKEIFYFVYKKSVILNITSINISIKALIDKYVFNTNYINV